jgi:hypothetical protein
MNTDINMATELTIGELDAVNGGQYRIYTMDTEGNQQGANKGGDLNPLMLGFWFSL